jgi:hypothetical protein
MDLSSARRGETRQPGVDVGNGDSSERGASAIFGEPLVRSRFDDLVFIDGLDDGRVDSDIVHTARRRYVCAVESRRCSW